MKKTVIIVIVALLVLLVIGGVGSYNNMVTKQENVTRAWSNVENQYQRRTDLIPNLVNTVKGYAAHEQSTLQAVTEARSQVTQVRIDPENLTPEALQQFQQAQSQVSSALGRLLAIAESYPDLKANQNFLELQAQLEGTENRIAVERGRFNEAAQDYNQYIRRFPRNIYAGIFGFHTRPYFEAQQGAQNAPVVEF